MTIDARRVAALAQAPRRGQQGSKGLDLAAVTQVLGLHGRLDNALGRPVAWSRAACRLGRTGTNRTAPQDGAGSREAATVCAGCPIFRDCANALMAGAPAEVRQWRERAEG
ncbi:hypothetical protein ACFYVL_14325 [Streptomyces sp. NPDC004111]|uniref:hypothetical protein n=1 Tax=Streptomyces sp. NPDC004111 TaxID=3364690 RepID=UPI0036C4B941